MDNPFQELNGAVINPAHVCHVCTQATTSFFRKGYPLENFVGTDEEVELLLKTTKTQIRNDKESQHRKWIELLEKNVANRARAES